MTREEAIDELHKHYVPEYVNYIVTALTDGATPSDAPTINAIPVPDNATNGDVIKAMFPDAEPIKKYTNSVFIRAWKPFFVACEFDTDWWNAKYKRVE